MSNVDIGFVVAIGGWVLLALHLAAEHLDTIVSAVERLWALLDPPPEPRITLVGPPSHVHLLDDTELVDADARGWV